MITEVWDNKFGMTETKSDWATQRMQEQAEANQRLIHTEDDPLIKDIDAAEINELLENNSKLHAEMKEIVDGVGKDAEVVTNSAGGKQSKAPMAMHLVDPIFLKKFASNKAEELEYIDESRSTTVDEEDRETYGCYRAIEWIAKFMQEPDLFYLQAALDCIEPEELQQVMTIAKVLQYGAERYEPNNWRLISEEEHINHALIHIIAHLAGDKQDDHIDHAMCRLMMAMATERSEGFSYTEYVKK